MTLLNTQMTALYSRLVCVETSSAHDYEIELITNHFMHTHILCESHF